MKLIFCKQCNDIVRLMDDVRYCICKSSAGRYLNNVDAIYSGQFCVPLGISNDTLVKALHRRDSISYDNIFKSFVIDEYCTTFKRVKNVETTEEQKS